MRAAAILGPGNLSKYVEKFRRVGNADWTLATPASSNDADVAVIFGGDGTVHRHLPQLVSLGLPVLVVPCGSGNDFARPLKLRSVHDSLAAWQHFTARGKNIRTIDLGLIRAIASAEAVAGGPPVQSSTSKTSDKSVRPTQAAHYFCGVAGVGIDTEIARRANALPKWFRAHGGYALCAPRELLRFAPFPMKVSMGNEDNTSAKPTILAAFANTPAYGGGMMIAPNAQLDDGKLDVCVVRAMDTFKLFCLFPTVYFGGHLGFGEVEYSQREAARIETEYPLDVYADGEYVCQTPVEVGVVRNVLKVIVPA